MLPIWVRCAAALLLVGALGCSKEKLNELVDQGKKSLDEGAKSVSQSVDQAKTSMSEGAKSVAQSVDQATGKAKETLQLSGKLEMTLDQPVTTSGCYAKFIPASGSRAAILQVQSYRDAASESFPSVFVRGPVTAENAAALVGQTFDVQVYAQSQANGPVWFTQRETPAQFKVTAVDNQQMTGEFVAGKLYRSDRSTTVDIAGKAQGIWPTP